ncbi:g2912 [Coccomyxa elongata]
MVKKRAGASKLRLRAERKAKEGAAAEAEQEREAAVTRRLQHKIAKRVQFLEKVAASRPAPRLGVQQGGTKKKRRNDRGPGRLGDLSNLTASLAEAAQEEDVKAAAKAAMQSRGLGAGGTRKRLRLVEKETKRLHQVLAHPQYRSDPIAAITSHLSATLPPPPEAPKPKPDPSMRKQQKALRKWKQKLQGPNSMADDAD